MSTTLCVASQRFLQLPKDTIQIGTQKSLTVIPAAADVGPYKGDYRLLLPMRS